MRMVFAPHAYPPSIGGAELYTRGLAETVASLGHQVLVLSPDVDSPEAFYELGHKSLGPARERIGGVTIERVRFANFHYRYWGRINDKKALASAIAQYLDGLTASIDSFDPEVVITLPHLFPNVREVFELRRSRSWKLTYAPMLHEDDPYWSVEAVAARVSAADGVIALTDHEKKRLLDSYGASPRATAVVPPGVDVDNRSSTGDREAMVLFVGRRSRSKRLEVLYQAMVEVWGAHPEARLTVAGPPATGGPDPLGMSPLTIDSRVDVLGALDDHDKSRLYSRAMMAVTPSLTESFGLTTLEAWSHATPVVAVGTPVNRSLISHGIDGILTNADAHSLAEGISELLQNPTYAEQLGAKGHQKVEREFTWEKSAEALLSLLEDS